MPVMLMALLVAVLYSFASLRVLKQYERGVAFFLGKYWGTKGPGLFFLPAGVSHVKRVSLRIMALDIPPQYTYWALYGDPRYKEPAMMHRWAYTQTQLMRVMADAGLVKLRSEPPKWHIPARDMRVVGVKPKPEGPQIVVADKQGNLQ